MRDESLQFLERLVNTPSPSGHEAQGTQAARREQDLPGLGKKAKGKVALALQLRQETTISLN